MTNKTSIFSNALIWFGAGVSIAEIITGTYFAPLGLAKGLAAIVTGHVIGGLLMFFTGLIGAKTERTAMETTALSFGKKGAVFFALLNAIQLLGWTGIMIYDGSLCASTLANGGTMTTKIAAVVIGALILVWILAGVTNLKIFNTIAMAALFALSVFLCFKIFSGRTGNFSGVAEEAMSFGAAVELAVAMPLSWLPVISDYTKDAEKKFGATFASVATYFAVSCWMYIIGMCATLATGEYAIDRVMIKAGLGLAGLVIIILSTVTTTFLDAFSAGISSESISKKIKGKYAAVIVTLLGTIGALVMNMDNITDFLYLIGSVFAPMTAILLADYFVCKKDSSQKKIDFASLIIWLIGFALYRIFMKVDFICGSTLPAMFVTFLIATIAGKLRR